MLSKWKKTLLSIMFVAVLAIPLGIVGADNEDGSTVSEDIDVNGNLESQSDMIMVERVDREAFYEDIGSIDLVDPEDAPFGFSTSNPNPEYGYMNSDKISPPEDAYKAVDRARYIKPTTRASDEENEQDFYDWANNSVITNTGEVVDGTLTWAEVAANRDMIDWYKVGFPSSPTTAGGSPVKNISLSLTEFSSSDGTLYEFAVVDDGTGQMTLADDYADLLEVYVLSDDDMFGRIDVGGAEWWYDDGDPNDGWTWSDNWTLDFWTPRHAEGQDNDGFSNGLDEDGWIYIGISYNYYLTQSSPTNRAGYTIDYKFELAFNSDAVRDNVANHWKNATSFSPLGTKQANIRMSGEENIMDWWTFTGVDNDKLWNMSIQINRTFGLIYDQMSASDLWDNWLEVLIIWKNDGDDDIWDTADDGYTGAMFIHSYYLSGGGYISDGTLDVWLNNNWTDAPDRQVWIGLNERPIHGAIQNGQLVGFYLPQHTVYCDYEITLAVGEVSPNVPPMISEVVVTSDFEQDTSGGYYDSEFLLEVTYQDEDNDPPSEINVYIDKDTPYEKLSDISNTPKDVFDNDYTDGKIYKLEMLGDDLTDNPFPHTVHVQAKDDVPSISIRTSKWSEFFEFTDGIRVWDDEPVEIHPNRQPFEELMEDDPTTYFELEGIDGQFKDPENSFEVFYIWNETHGNWTDNYDSEIMNIDVVEFEGLWQIAVTPKHNQHGNEPIRLQAEDEHSWVNLTTSITIREANDPPTVKEIEIEIDGKTFTYEVDNVDPLRPVIHLEDEVEFLEDTEYTLNIIAEDTDLEDDRTELEYSYVRGSSSDWEEDPDVGYNTGVVTFTPVNNDVRAGNDKMVFSVDDHRTDGEIKLEVYLELTNTPDAPTIMIPSTTSRTWKQFSKISIRPIASDEDKNDQITFSVNFEEAIGDEYDSIEDQLPYMSVQKGIDWEITPTTGDFWFEVDDQNIWKTSSGMVKQQEITVVFMATDKDGETAIASINLVLNDENEEPPRPDSISVNPLKPNAKEPVNFWVESVVDPDGDRLTYKWDFGDGSTGEGINVNHTYATKGYKTVQMWVEDGQFATEKISIRVEVAEEITGDDDDDIVPDDDDDTRPVEDTNDNTMIIIIAVVIIVVVVLVVVLFIFLLMRKKPAPTAQMYPGYDQQALGAYGQQGLPPGAVGELPPQATPELPPAAEGEYPPENLPPAEGQAPVEQPPMEPQPEFTPPTPDMAAPVAAAPEMATPEPAPEQPAGNACPSCGAAVDPTWFLCPNCKSPLQ